MSVAAALVPDRPLRVASISSVVALHAIALWVTLMPSEAAETVAPPQVLSVSFVAPEPEPVKPPEPLPPSPPPPKPVLKPKPKPLIASARAEPVADAIVTPPPDETADEPAEPVAAYTPAEAAPAEPGPPEPPRFDMKYLNNPYPPYPSMSKKLREQGTVQLRVLVGISGEAISVEIASSSGYSRLDDAARRAVRQWKFVPSKRGNDAVEGIALVPIVFSLNQS